MADILHPGLRFLHYVLVLGLFGSTAFRAFGMRRIVVAPEKGWRVLIVACAISAPIVSSYLMLASIAEMMGQPVAMLDWATVEAMLISTDMGWAFMVRIVMLVLAAAFLLLSPNRRLSLATLFYALAILTLGWSGHAAATEGMNGLLHRLNNGVHLLAAGLWIGAIAWFLRLVVAAHRTPDQISPEPLLGAMHRFAPLGMTLVVLVTTTGLINAHLIFGLGNSGQVLATDYGRLLTAKVALIAFMLVFAARNASIGRHQARADKGPVATTLAALRVSLAAELLLATAVLLIVAFVGLASPMG